jgi:ketosteroid isomerase-like protein
MRPASACHRDAVALYEPDAVLVPQPDAELLAGTEAIREALAAFTALRPSL